MEAEETTSVQADYVNFPQYEERKKYLQEELLPSVDETLLDTVELRKLQPAEVQKQLRRELDAKLKRLDNKVPVEPIVSTPCEAVETLGKAKSSVTTLSQSSTEVASLLVDYEKSLNTLKGLQSLLGSQYQDEFN